MRRLRDVILGADPSMSERVRYGVTFASSKSGDFAAFVRYREPGVNLRLMRGGRLQGRDRHLEGRIVKRMRIKDERQASARAAELGDGEGVVLPGRCRETAVEEGDPSLKPRREGCGR